MSNRRKLSREKAPLPEPEGGRDSPSGTTVVYDYQNYPHSEPEEEDKKGEEGFDLHIKLLMLGDSGVGKTSLVRQYANEEFSTNFITTIGIDYKIKLLDVGDTRVKLQIWDTAGQERFRTITTSYFKGANGIMLVYDITDRETFKNIAVWAKDIKENADPQVCIVLVGNKKDLEKDRSVSYEEGLQMARKMNVHFWEVSAKVGENVNTAYEDIAQNTKENMLHPENIVKRPKLDSIVLQDHSLKKGKHQESFSRRQDGSGPETHRKSNCC